jgi:glycerol-3-phosphate cytidylyltransferase
MKKGYTAGVFDLFHIGHLNVIKNAKKNCDYLIVAVSTDNLVRKYKNKTPIIPFEERAEIVKSIKYVDEVVPQTDRDKISAYEKYKFDIMFVGDDWKGDLQFQKVDEYMRKHGGKVEYLPYTKEVSSTILKVVLDKIYKAKQ